MFKNALLVAFLTISSSYALSLDEIVNRALDNNYDLKSLEKSIDVAKAQIEVSSHWKNPTLTLGVNDIHFDEPTSRDLEPMQAQYIGFSQIIPMGDKLDIQEGIAKKSKNIATFSLEDKKLEFKAKIYEYAYTIRILEQKYDLLNKYQHNIKSLEKLTHALYENGNTTQAEVINSEVSFAKIELKKQKLQNIIKTLYLKLEGITYTKIETIVMPLVLKKIKIDPTFDTHPKILMTIENTKKLNDISKLEIAKKTSDIKLNLAYFQRDDKYKDYANISVNIPLSLYGTENIKSLQAKIKSQKNSDKLVELKQKFKTKVLILQNDIDTSIQTYTLLEKTIIPLKQQIQTTMEAYNSFDQIKPQATIKNLNEVISYELQRLDEMKRYFTSVSKSTYFTQGKL